MKREIKFRAILKNEHTPTEVYGIDFMTLCVIVLVGGQKEWLEFKELIQFTGLKDKNGKEIFEGDIVRNKLSFVKGNPVNKDNPIFKNYIVDWHDGQQLGFRIKNKHNIIPLNRNKVFNAQSEVIGNIYENPELLK